MNSSTLGSMSPLFEGRRPSPIPPPPAGGEIKKLRERLLKQNKGAGRLLTDPACEFLAAAVVSPAYVRAQLNRPNIRPTATGHLEVIYATVPVDCLAPDPGNGRVVGATAWPASDRVEGQTLKLWTPADVLPHPESPAEAIIHSDTVPAFKRVLEEAADRTKLLNREMREKVERDGILDPLLCQLVHVMTADGHSGVALVTRDGSTRCSFAKEAHRLGVHDAFFGAGRDVEHRRQRWQEMRRRLESSVDDITEPELIQLRTFLVDVQIVIGFHTDDDRVTVLDAMDDIVRRTHVETSHPWLPVAQSNSEADLVLAALRNGQHISQEEFLLYGGTLTRPAREQKGLPVEPDLVLADLLKALGATQSRNALEPLHQDMRRQTGAGNIRNTYKAQLAGSLGLRQFPVDGRSLGVASLTLEETLRLDAIWDEHWDNTNRSPADLGAAAIAELAAGGPGASCRELAIKAAGYLAASGWLKRQIAGGRGIDRDQRAPNMVLDAMYRCEHGVHVLVEALEAGRRGTDAHAIKTNGTPEVNVSGDIRPLDNEWIRRAFGEEQPKSSTMPGGAPVTDAETPREHVARLVRRMESGVHELSRSLADAEKVKDDDGASYLERRGWPRGEVSPLADQLRSLAEQLTLMGLRSDASPVVPPAEQLDMIGMDTGEAA